MDWGPVSAKRPNSAPNRMVEIGGRPILWHIMKMYAHYGMREFVLCLGYRGNMIKDYFLNYEAMNNDFKICLGRKSHVQFMGAHHEQDFAVTLADTGLETMTGGRLQARCTLPRKRRNVSADLRRRLSDVNIADLLEFHHSHGRIATVTSVPPISRFGMIEIDSKGQVHNFSEKPKANGVISAGFFVFNRRVLRLPRRRRIAFSSANHWNASRAKASSWPIVITAFSMPWTLSANTST